MMSANNSSSPNDSFFDASCHGTTSDNDGTLLSLRIYFFSSLFFVLVGLVGNTLSMLVFTSKDMLTVSSNAYLLLLAASDSLYLISVFFTKTLTIMRCWYFVNSEVDIVNRNHIVCVLLQYLSDLFSNYSTCLILAFTIERSVAVFLPIKFKELCTVWRARVACVSIFVVVASFIAPYHVLSIGLYPDYHICAILAEHEAIFSILYVVEMSVFRVIPVLLIAILNAFIITRVTRLTRYYYQLTALRLGEKSSRSNLLKPFVMK